MALDGAATLCAMAARKRPGLSENTRERIRTTMLVKRLEEHILSREPILDATQVRAIEILLRKTLPDLQAVTLQGELEHNVRLAVTLTPHGR